jgi:hypothetical protein
MNGATSSQYGVLGVDKTCQRVEPGRLQRQPDSHQARSADPVGERTCDPSGE